MKHLKVILIAIVATCATLSASAQSLIESVIAQIEKSKGVMVTYTEKRDPKTKKPYKSTKIITLSDKNLIQKLQQALKKDEPNAVEITRVNNNFSTLKFIENNIKSEYSVSKTVDDGPWDGTWTIIVTKKSTNTDYKVISGNGFSIDLSSLEGLGLGDIDTSSLDRYEIITPHN